MSKQAFKIINLNTDQSIPAQSRLYENMDVVEDMGHQSRNLRLWADNLGLAYLRQRIHYLRQKHTEPWLTFLGSGDFHHFTLALLESLPKDEPVTLILVDNHPDWFCEHPVFHCGNWISGVLALPEIESVILVGQDSTDLRGYHFWNAPLPDLCSGRLRLYPYRRAGSFIPLKWPNSVKGVSASTKNLFGTHINYTTIASMGEEQFFEKLAGELAGQHVYLSIDKDCLQQNAAITDWEQGCLSLSGLLCGIRHLREHCTIVGADICGERAQQELVGFAKRLDARRLRHNKSIMAEINGLNEKTNLELLQTFIPLVMPEAGQLCPI